jgi:hypothetical protein
MHVFQYDASQDDLLDDDILVDDTIDDHTFKACQIGLMTDEEVNEKYVKGDVRIVTEQARYQLTTIAGMVESDYYELNPEFQRRRRWNVEKKSRLIESFIMNVPVPPIFLYEDEFSHYQVMDGIQRLFTIYEFYKDKLELESLKEWKELNGRTYSKLPEQIRRGIDRRYLSSVILLRETAKDPKEAQRLKQLVFERINSGGVELLPQESRNALYNGPMNKLCIKLSRNIYLCKMWGIPEPTENERLNQEISKELQDNETYRRMDDVELVLRFFAFRDKQPSSGKSLREFFTEYLREANEYPTNRFNEYGKIFENTIRLVYDTFQDRAFYLWRPRRGKWDWHDKPSYIVYDALMYSFSQHIKNAEEITSHCQEFKDGIIKLYETKSEEFSGRKTNLKNIKARRSSFDVLVKSIIGEA